MPSASSQALREDKAAKISGFERHRPRFLLDPSSIPDIWGGMTGRIWIIHSAWNRQRIHDELLEDLACPHSDAGHELRRLKISQEQVLAVLDHINRYGNHLVEGDVTAKTHILGTIRCLYEPTQIQEINSWCLGETKTEVETTRRFERIKEDNIILVGGPTGNAVTDLFLCAAGLRWLFPEEKGLSHAIRRYPGDKDPITPVGTPPDGLESDCGIFFRGTNPFNPRRRLYAVMGAYAWGTQASAALACAGPSASEVLLTRDCPEIQELPVELCAWVRIRHGYCRGEPTSMEDPRCCFQIESPKPPKGREWRPHSNPSSINRTLVALKDLMALERTEELYLIPARIQTILGFGLSTAVLAALTLAVWLQQIPQVWGIAGIPLALAGCLLSFFRLWPAVVQDRQDLPKGVRSK